GSETFSYSSFGDKVIQESQLPAGWDLTDITCPNATVTYSSDGQTYHGTFTAGDSYAKVHLSPGDDVTCTYTNVKHGGVLVAKVADPVSSTDTFNFTTTSLTPADPTLDGNGNAG